MTINEFLEKLKQTPRTWVMDFGHIRLQVPKRHFPYGFFVSCCPITAVDGRDRHARYYKECAANLGLSEQDANAIAHAADPNGNGTELRKQLIAACGLDARGLS